LSSGRLTGKQAVRPAPFLPAAPYDYLVGLGITCLWLLAVQGTFDYGWYKVGTRRACTNRADRLSSRVPGRSGQTHIKHQATEQQLPGMRQKGFRTGEHFRPVPRTGNQHLEPSSCWWLSRPMSNDWKQHSIARAKRTATCRAILAANDPETVT
jgi:hypothetical protein